MKTVGCLLLALLSFAPALQADETYDPSLLIGTWQARKYVTFFEDGRVGVRQSEGAPLETRDRSWSLKGNVLNWVAPEGGSEETIVSLTKDKLVLKDPDSEARTTYTRVKSSN